MTSRTHRLGRERRQIRQTRPLLDRIHLLKSENVGVQVLHALDEAVQVHAMPERAPMQDVERHQLHG
jgi:hypothetical protein